MMTPVEVPLAVLVGLDLLFQVHRSRIERREHRIELEKLDTIYDVVLSRAERLPGEEAKKDPDGAKGAQSMAGHTTHNWLPSSAYIAGGTYGQNLSADGYDDDKAVSHTFNSYDFNDQRVPSKIVEKSSNSAELKKSKRKKKA